MLPDRLRQLYRHHRECPRCGLELPPDGAGVAQGPTTRNARICTRQIARLLRHTELMRSLLQHRQSLHNKRRTPRRAKTGEVKRREDSLLKLLTSDKLGEGGNMRTPDGVTSSISRRTRTLQHCANFYGPCGGFHNRHPQ
jgi:hypothetical protein